MPEMSWRQWVKNTFVVIQYTVEASFLSIDIFSDIVMWVRFMTRVLIRGLLAAVLINSD